MTDTKQDGDYLCLAGAVFDIIGILQDRPASGGDGTDNWERIVNIIAERDSLPNNEVKVIEEAIAEAYRGWSDAQRRSIWYETDSGMADDDDDDSLCDTSFNGIGYALQLEMLEEVTRTAWQEADNLKKQWLGNLAGEKRQPSSVKETKARGIPLRITSYKCLNRLLTVSPGTTTKHSLRLRSKNDD